MSLRRFTVYLLLFSLSGCSGVFYQPSKKHFTQPEKFGLKFQDIWFQSADGNKLHGWFFPSRTKETKGTIIQFHGNAENISTHFYSLIWLVEEGYNLFTWDYRGYGNSEGEPDQRGVYVDSLAALTKGRELHMGRGLLIVYGQSLGGAISLRALPDFKHAKDINLLVHDSAFASYQDVAFNMLRGRWFLWPFSPLAFVLVSDEYAADKVIEKIYWPTLVVAGEKDSIIPSQMGKKTFKELPSTQKWLWKLPEGGHINVFHHAQGRYRKDFLELLNQLKLR